MSIPTRRRGDALFASHASAVPSPQPISRIRASRGIPRVAAIQGISTVACHQLRAGSTGNGGSSTTMALKWLMPTFERNAGARYIAGEVLQ